MRWLINCPTRGKLTLGFGIVFLCLALVTLLAYQGIAALQQSQQRLARRELANAESLSALRSHVNGMQATVLTMMSHQTHPGKEAWHQEAKHYTREARTTMRQLLQRAETLSQSSQGANKLAAQDLAWGQQIRQLAALLNDFQKTQDAQVIPLIYAGDIKAARQFTLYIQTERYLKIAALTAELAAQAEQQAHTALSNSNLQAQGTVRLFLIIGALTLLCSCWMVAFLNRSIADPLSMISGAAARIAAGDLTVQLPHEQRRDEIGVLTQTFNRMTHSLQEITRVADQIAAGDLTVKIQPRSDKDLLGRAFAALDFQAEELRKKNAHMEADLKLAREIQQAFLPLQYRHFTPRTPSQKCVLNFHHHYQSSSDLGGDFFDIWELSENEIGVFICDVMGHGVRASLVTAILRGLVEELRPVAGNPGHFLSEVNRDLVTILKRTRTPLFATAFYLVADTARGQWRFANAGHPNPLWMHRTLHTVGFLPEEVQKVGPALGVFDDAAYETNERELSVNDRIVLATDGLTESTNADGEEYGEARLIATAQRCLALPPERFFEVLLDDICRFSGVAGFEDDICLINVDVCTITPLIETESQFLHNSCAVQKTPKNALTSALMSDT